MNITFAPEQLDQFIQTHEFLMSRVRYITNRIQQIYFAEFKDGFPSRLKDQIENDIDSIQDFDDGKITFNTHRMSYGEFEVEYLELPRELFFLGDAKLDDELLKMLQAEQDAHKKHKELIETEKREKAHQDYLRLKKMFENE